MQSHTPSHTHTHTVSRNMIKSMVHLVPQDLTSTWKKLPFSTKVLPFYTHRGPTGFLSNFFPRAFVYKLPKFVRIYAGERVTVKHAEQAIMLTKAALFGDKEAYDRMLQALSPASCKRLGRMVRNFDQRVWDTHACRIICHILKGKFANKPLRALLLDTNDLVLAEASPRDRIWGIGLAKTDPRAAIPADWRGTNLLGWALMQERERLRHAE